MPDIYEEFERRGYRRFSERFKDLFRDKLAILNSQIQEKLLEIVASHSFKYPELPGVSFFTQLLKMKMLSQESRKF